MKFANIARIGSAAFVAVTIAAHPAAAAAPPLCPDGSKTVYEARHKAGSLRIAVCSTSGTISVYSSVISKADPTPKLWAHAEGADRAKSFVLRRYTRARTTYLKFEFTAQDGRRVAIYDDFADGETSTRVGWTTPSDGAVMEPREFVAVAEPLMLMELEPVVSVQPYDE